MQPKGKSKEFTSAFTIGFGDECLLIPLTPQESLTLCKCGCQMLVLTPQPMS